MNRVAVFSFAFACAACGTNASVGSPAPGGGGVDASTGSGGTTVDAGAVVDAGTDAGTNVQSGPDTVDPAGKGGAVHRLAFTAFGDIRPSFPDEDFGYPNNTIKSIVSGMAALQPQFGVASGDYMYVEYLPSSAKGQLNALLDDEKGFGKPIFHAMGNHECQSFSDVNCPNLNESTNITTYMQMLVPWSKVPWFSFTIHTDRGDAKFAFIAVNAWTPAQATWLEQTLSQPTPYTFVIRHQPTPDDGDPSSAEGVTGSNAILDKYPVTLYIFGHVHEYKRIAANRMIVGNAGAPLDSGAFGYASVVQREDGNIGVTEYAQGTNAQVDTWAVTPAGADTP